MDCLTAYLNPIHIGVGDITHVAQELAQLSHCATLTGPDIIPEQLFTTSRQCRPPASGQYVYVFMNQTAEMLILYEVKVYEAEGTWFLKFTNHISRAARVGRTEATAWYCKMSVVHDILMPI